ncbi:glycosyltransferase involved in cell wall biosynthesis [Sphingomonas trueperi]
MFRTAHVHFNLRRRLYRLRSNLAPGIMHWSYPVPIMLEGWTNIYTVHDTIPLDRPDLSPIEPRRHRAVLNAIAEHGDRIITVSDDARASIVHALACRPDFVADAGQSVELSEDLSGDTLSGLPEGVLAGSYLLCVGSIEPRKNLSAILAAYQRSGVSMPLLIAGPDGWCAEPILAEIAQTAGAVRLPYQSRAALLHLIANARALIFPTLAEGFGLPVIEAMALGTPVLTSDRGALAEVAGNAALTVDPTDLAAMSAAFHRITTDDELALGLAQKGRIRAQAFSKARFVDRLAAIYDETLSNSLGVSNARRR